MIIYENSPLFRKLIAVLGVVIALALLLSLNGCVVARYDATAGSESLEVKTLFKSVDGFNASRGSPNEDSFSIHIDKTHTQDPVQTMAQMMQMMQMMQGMAAPPPPASN
jgi:hypothetical protein